MTQYLLPTQDLWWEAAGFPGDQSEKSPGLSPDVKRKLLNRTKRTALRSIGGIVASDLLPDESQLRGLIKQAGLRVTHFEDGPERYLVIAEKGAR